MKHSDNPTLRHARREAYVLFGVWAIATATCCIASACLGYERADRPASQMRLDPILGVPSWFFWAVLVPWAACAIFTVVFAGFFMKEDDLGSDLATATDFDVREASHASR